jgi:hypothetical protein
MKVKPRVFWLVKQDGQEEEGYFKRYSTCTGGRRNSVVNILTHPIPPIPTYPAGKKSLSPSQQQLLNSRNRKSKRPHSQKMGWGNFRAPYPHKKRKIKTHSWRRHHLRLEIPTPSPSPSHYLIVFFNATKQKPKNATPKAAKTTSESHGNGCPSAEALRQRHACVNGDR